MPRHLTSSTRPLAPLMAASGLLPIRGLAARRGATRGLRRLRQDYARAAALGVSGLRLHGRPLGAGLGAARAAAGAQSRRAAARLRCMDRQLWRCIEFHVGKARAWVRFKGMQIVGLDESSLRRGQD